MDNILEETASGTHREVLLKRCRARFIETLGVAAGHAGLGYPSLLEVLAHGAGRVFDELAGLRSREEFVKLRSLTASRISLVHPEDMDLTVSLINLAHDLTDACGKHLPRLHLLFMTMLDQQSSELEQLPVGPDAACAALRELCDSDDLPSGLRLEIPSRMEKPLALELDLLYQSLCQELGEAGIPPKSLLRSGSGQGTSYAEEDRRGAVEVTAPEASRGSSSLQRLQQDVLNRRLPSDRTAATVTDPSLRQAILDQVTNWLTERQHEAARQTVGDSAQVNLGDLSRLLPAGSNAALEAINLTFDALLADREMSAGVKLSLGRLRLPVCKAVLMDEDVLGDAEHPVRRLLGSMLRLANGLEVDEKEDHPVCRAIEEAAVLIQRDFERDMTIFVQAAEPLERLEADREACAANRVAQLMEVVEWEARREQARSRSARAIKALCATEAPLPVKVFLERLWLRVLAYLHQTKGEKSSEWVQALAVADRLIASVQPKTDAEARKGLASELPALLGQLREGLDLIGTPEILRERALHSFATLHSAALHGRSVDSTNLEDELPPSMPPRVDTVKECPDLYIVRLSPDSEQERELPEGLSPLRPGDWLQITPPGMSCQRLRVGWLGGGPRMLLLTRPDDALAFLLPVRWLTINPEARVVPTGDPFERAAVAAMKKT